MILTVDTGGTKTLLAVFDESGRPAGEVRFPTPHDPDEYTAKLSEAIHENYLSKQLKLDAVVIAVPGIVKNNIAVWCGNLGWQNFDIAGELKDYLKCPVWLENDANLAGLAETRALSDRPDSSLYVTISTGIGTGIIVNGEILDGLSQAEGGHMPVEYDGRVRQWESFASGRAIKDTYKKYARDIHDAKTWRQIADKISRGFLAIIPLLQPDVIIIGGSIGTYFDRYSDQLNQLLKTRLPDHIPLPAIRQAAHPEEAVIYGGYFYAKDRLAS
ncbi:MAG TPA: ROK family protein [Candidatus Saccharimonadales bacterium]|nr:ROK family protein [Candidatus Saccharimonadales bacterium]